MLLTDSYCADQTVLKIPCLVYVIVAYPVREASGGSNSQEKVEKTHMYS